MCQVSSLDKLLWARRINTLVGQPGSFSPLHAKGLIECCDRQLHQGHLAEWQNGLSKKNGILRRRNEGGRGEERYKAKNAK